MDATVTATDRDADLTGRLRGLARYGAGWDGRQAEAADPAAIDLACAFVAEIGGGAGLEPSMDGDGTVNVAGDVGGDRLMLTFGADGVVEVSRREGGSWSASGSHRIASGGRVSVPDELRALLAPIRRAA